MDAFPKAAGSLVQRTVSGRVLVDAKERIGRPPEMTCRFGSAAAEGIGAHPIPHDQGESPVCGPGGHGQTMCLSPMNPTFMAPLTASSRQARGGRSTVSRHRIPHGGGFAPACGRIQV